MRRAMFSETPGGVGLNLAGFCYPSVIQTCTERALRGMQPCLSPRTDTRRALMRSRGDLACLRIYQDETVRAPDTHK